MKRKYHIVAAKNNKANPVFYGKKGCIFAFVRRGNGGWHKPIKHPEDFENWS
jgi:hypothetical protein